MRSDARRGGLAAPDLFAVGCHDSAPGVSNGVPRVRFTREAPTLHEAISTAIRDVRKAGLDILRIEPEGIVTPEQARNLLAQPAAK